MKTCSVTAYDINDNLVVDWKKTFKGKTKTAFNRFQKSIDQYFFDNNLEFQRSEIKVTG
tara:strand:+ start:819 stop:995 length:177 start_codon:yes stop_codon:yes gene_type:complete